MAAKKNPKTKIDHEYLAAVLGEIRDQPPWRASADKEMDYYDGNQLTSDILQAMQDKGIPPSIENVVASVLDDICGMEEKNRTDFRCEPDGEIDDQESEQVSNAINYKLNKAEKASGADKACGDSHRTQSWVGIGWVEVARETDPFRFPYRCKSVHRNEIWWDMLAKEPDISDARWILRRRWTDLAVAQMMFPAKKELIATAGTGIWNRIDDLSLDTSDEVGVPDLAQSWDIERGWSVEEQEWRLTDTKRVCLFELYTKEWEEVLILKMAGGRVVEFDAENQNHIAAIYMGTRPEKAKISRIYKHFFIGPHLLHSEAIEFRRFPYVPFFGFIEDRTGVPYGVGRRLIYLQDEVNARISKMQWLLAATMTVRTDGAVAMDEDLFHLEVARPDADIILDQSHMALPGAMFDRKTNESLNEQQFKRLVDLRESIKSVSNVSRAFSGDETADNSGALSQMIEQSVQGLARLRGNYAYARMVVGELLMEMIIHDMGANPQQVMVKGNAIREDMRIDLNVPTEQNGFRFLTNDVQRTRLKVTLNDVPSTPTFRQQQLTALSEAFKSAPPQYQAVMMPHLMHLANIPNKEEIVKAILEINQNASLTEEQVKQRVAEAVEAERTKWMVEQKTRDLDLKERKTAAEIELLVEQTISKRIEQIYSGTQAAVQIASMPGVAPAADQVLRSAGSRDQDAAPIVAAPSGMPVVAAPDVRQNTSPMFPPRTQDAEMQEPTPSMPEDMAGPGPDAGLNQGIEAQGVQI